VALLVCGGCRGILGAVAVRTLVAADPSDDMTQPESDVPTLLGAPDRLTDRERRVVALAAGAPVLVAALVLSPVALLTGSSAGEVAVAALVYGGLLGLAAAFVAVDRLQARQCPRCHRRRERSGPRCACGYDLKRRPRYACPDRHAVYLDEGVCECGKRLQLLATARGVGPEVLMVLKIGGWLLAFLLGVGVILNVLEGRL
jgi:hypothetical protein